MCVIIICGIISGAISVLLSVYTYYLYLSLRGYYTGSQNYDIHSNSAVQFGCYIS